MKRLWHDPHYKRIHKLRSRNRNLRRLRFLLGRRIDNQFDQGVSKQNLKQYGEFKHLPYPAARIIAPRQMCFLRNPEEMARFIANLNYCLHVRQPVLVFMEAVEELELNAVTVLLAVMVRFKSRRIKFSGTMPRDTNARHILEESGFFEHLIGNYRATEAYDLTGPSIQTHGNVRVDGEFSQALINRASRTIWGGERRCRGVQRVLIELMQNTVNHAAGTSNNHNDKHYWISVQELHRENKTIFCFVDFGVGIFESLATRHTWFESVVSFVTNLVGYHSNAYILRLILTGTLHKTVTGQYFRGKGLPGVYQAFKRDQISNLSIITNDVFFSAANDTYVTLKTPFAGTFYSWELSQANPSLPK